MGWTLLINSCNNWTWREWGDSSCSLTLYLIQMVSSFVYFVTFGWPFELIIVSSSKLESDRCSEMDSWEGLVWFLEIRLDLQGAISRSSFWSVRRRKALSQGDQQEKNFYTKDNLTKIIFLNYYLFKNQQQNAHFEITLTKTTKHHQTSIQNTHQIHTNYTQIQQTLKSPSFNQFSTKFNKWTIKIYLLELIYSNIIIIISIFIVLSMTWNN